MRKNAYPFFIARERYSCVIKALRGCTGKGNHMNYQVQGNCLTIFLPHEVDHHNAEEIRRESDRLIEKHHIRYVIFDFRETNFMDSSGIGVIMGRYKRLYMMGGEVCAVHTSDRVKKILTMSGTAKIMHIYEEEQ